MTCKHAFFQKYSGHSTNTLGLLNTFLERHLKGFPNPVLQWEESSPAEAEQTVGYVRQRSPWRVLVCRVRLRKAAWRRRQQSGSSEELQSHVCSAGCTLNSAGKQWETSALSGFFLTGVTGVSGRRSDYWLFAFVPVLLSGHFAQRSETVHCHLVFRKFTTSSNRKHKDSKSIFYKVKTSP